MWMGIEKEDVDLEGRVGVWEAVEKSWTMRESRCFWGWGNGKRACLGNLKKIRAAACFLKRQLRK